MTTEKEKRKKGKKVKRRILNLFILLCFTTAALLLYQSVVTKLDEKKTIETYDEIEKIYIDSVKAAELETPVPLASETPSLEITELPEPTETAEPTPTPTPSPEPRDTIPQREVLDRSETINYFNSLLDVNEDVRGWIKIPESLINYPVVQGIDNEFYLTRNIYGKETISASIFMDYRNNTQELDDNTIIYGHNLNTTMFNDLDYYVDEETRDEFMITSGIIRFDTVYKIMYWEVYSAYIVDKDDFNYLITNFSIESKHQSFLDETMERSFIDTGIVVTIEDNILTLSTCNHWFNDSRTVIHARLITN